MGNTSDLRHWDIKFIQNLEDPNFGSIDIYKNQAGKHVMKLRRTFIRNGDDRPLQDFLEFLQFAKDSQGLNTHRCFQQGELITPILHAEKIVQNNLCIVYEVYDTYCEYFNFTLHDMIKHRKEMDIDELWLCFHWLLKLANLLTNNNWRLQGGIQLDNIFITLKGLPTISIHFLTKIREDDEFLNQKKGNKEQIQLEQISRIILQLFCMAEISEDENCELFLRKFEKADQLLGKIIGSFLRKSVGKQKVHNEASILKQVEGLIQKKEVTLSRQIKLNKFKYIIPKPEIKEKADNLNGGNAKEQDGQKNNKNSIDTSKNEFLISQSSNNLEDNSKEASRVTVNSLQGRKNKGSSNSSMRESQKKTILSRLENGYFSNANPLSKASSLANQIEGRKRASQKQWEKLSQRKQLLLKSETGMKKGNNEKENILQNSIGQVKTSKQSWSRRIVNQHLKDSNRGVK